MLQIFLACYFKKKASAKILYEKGWAGNVWTHTCKHTRKNLMTFVFLYIHICAKLLYSFGRWQIDS